MREPNCFPPAEHNPSSLTPTSSSQPPVALQELLCLRPQLIPDSPGLFRDVPCLHCTPAAPPLPSTSRTSSSSPCCCLICALFRPLAPHKHLRRTRVLPANSCDFHLPARKTPRLPLQQLSGASPLPGCPKVAFPEPLHPSHIPRPWDPPSSPPARGGGSRGAPTRVAGAVPWEM